MQKDPYVWGALDVLKKAVIDDVIPVPDDLKEDFGIYSQETKHLFSVKDTEDALKEIENKRLKMNSQIIN